MCELSCQLSEINEIGVEWNCSPAWTKLHVNTWEREMEVKGEVHLKDAEGSSS